MYGTGLPATGALGLMTGAAITSSALLAGFALLMLAGMVYILVCNAMRRRADQRP